ncbi:MAG: T9SS type A sorting domain-containing protein, partial [Bacteroidetes bacterium]
DSTNYINYNGRINIEIRGSSSQVKQKKQYGFTTYQADNITKDNVSLLGLPHENDWILNGLAFEPSLIRDYICYNLSRMIGEYASRTVFCEVMLNGSYNGLYVLQEKIKQGPDRVNVMNIETTNNTFPKITGGYVTKADKTAGSDVAAWTMSSHIGINDVAFIHVQPQPQTVTPQQNEYIKSEFIKLGKSAAVGDASFETGYPSVIDIPSFVDYMIISEISANADAYQFSTYYHKDRNGKLRAGPIWDNNLTFGYDLSIWGFDRSKTDTWQFSNGDNEGAAFWKDLFNNPEFRCCLSRRWNQLIQPGQPLNYSVIEPFIDQTVDKISEASVRDSIRWSYDRKEYIFKAEITKIENFLQLRIPWMTSAIGPSSNCSNVEIPPLVITRIMYSPTTSVSFPNANDQEFIEIKNTGNMTINLAGVYFSGTGFIYQFPPSARILPNSTKILASKMDVFRSKYGFAASGQFTRNLSSKGENLVLADGFGNVIDSVYYSSQPPWPDADSNGYYLELIDPLSDNNIATNWIASTNTLVSVEDVNNNPELKFYPTPVSGTLTIESSANINILQLFDFQGRRLRTINVNSGTYSLDMSSCSPGLYLIELITTDGNFVKKVIKD